MCSSDLFPSYDRRGQPNKTGTEVGLRAQEIGINMANAMSQIKLNESQANKNEAEANKISGVDTEAQKATIDNLIAQEIGINMANAMSQIKLNESQANKNEAEANKIMGKPSTINGYTSPTKQAKC